MSGKPIRIPSDPADRDVLFRFAGLTDDERIAMEEWCAEQQAAQEARQRRGWELSHGLVMP